MHRQYNGGKMDGFFTTAQHDNGDGQQAMPYYTARELPFYYCLFEDSALCANYFCSLLGPTLPNRFYLMSGTSGGVTNERAVGLRGVRLDRLADHPRPARGRGRELEDLLHRLDDVTKGDSDNVAVFWTRWAHDPRTTGTKDDYLNDLARRPAAAGLVDHLERLDGLDEHPRPTSRSAWATRRR